MIAMIVVVDAGRPYIFSRGDARGRRPKRRQALHLGLSSQKRLWLQEPPSSLVFNKDETFRPISCK